MQKSESKTAQIKWICSQLFLIQTYIFFETVCNPNYTLVFYKNTEPKIVLKFLLFQTIELLFCWGPKSEAGSLIKLFL